MPYALATPYLILAMPKATPCLPFGMARGYMPFGHVRHVKSISVLLLRNPYLLTRRVTNRRYANRRFASMHGMQDLYGRVYVVSKSKICCANIPFRHDFT